MIVGNLYLLSIPCVALFFWLPSSHHIESCSEGPRLLWSLYFNLISTRVDHIHSMPSGVHVVSDPDGTLGFEHCMEEVLYSVYDMALTLLLCHTRYSLALVYPAQPSSLLS